MIKKALIDLKENNINLTNIEDINEYIQNDTTYLENNTLYYKNIPEGLMFLINYKNGTTISFKNNLNNFGTMIDVSRGAVFKVSYIKKLIRTKSLMGVNELWIYMEDIYELENYPVFGYMRGKYSKEEIEEIVNYALLYEVKLVPAIQTLGHMEQFLRWLSQTSKYKDQPNVLLARDENVKNLIYEMLLTIKSMFKTDKIHIGLDETWGFGFGTFYKKNGYIPQIKIFLEHLNMVNDLALTVGFKDILVWSDMFYRFMSEKNSYYDPNIILNKEIIESMPDNISLVYWDYYNSKYELVKKMLNNHKLITKKVVFASGTWIWTRLTYDKNKTNSYMDTHIKASTDSNIKDFILTQWMDDGAYGDHETTLLGVFDTSYKALTTNEINKVVFKEITNQDYEIINNKTIINNTSFSQVAVLWDDPQFSVYLNNLTNNELNKFDKILNEQKKLVDLYSSNNDYLYEYSISIINYYKMLGRREMIKGYKNNNIKVEDIYLKVVSNLEFLVNIYRDRWYNNYKMYGLELIQSRLFQQIGRAKEMIILSHKFNNKEIIQIDGLNDKVAIYNENLYDKHSLIAFTTKPA